MRSIRLVNMHKEKFASVSHILKNSLNTHNCWCSWWLLFVTEYFIEQTFSNLTRIRLSDLAGVFFRFLNTGVFYSERNGKN